MRRLGTIGIVLALIGGLFALWAAGQPWYRAQALLEAALTGQTLSSGLATALPLAAVAAVAAELVVGRLGRRILSCCAAVLAVAAVISAVTTRSTQVLGAAHWWSLRTPAFFVYVACAGAVAVGAGLAIVWPGRARTRGAAASTRDDAWSVLDRGEDPTAG